MPVGDGGGRQTARAGRAASRLTRQPTRWRCLTPSAVTEEALHIASRGSQALLERCPAVASRMFKSQKAWHAAPGPLQWQVDDIDVLYEWNGRWESMERQVGRGQVRILADSRILDMLRYPIVISRYLQISFCWHTYQDLLSSHLTFLFHTDLDCK